MKITKKITLIGLAFAFIISACTMEKRQYLSGYDIQWNKKAKAVKQKRNEPQVASDGINDRQAVENNPAENNNAVVNNDSIANKVEENAGLIASADDKQIFIPKTETVVLAKKQIQNANGKKDIIAPKNSISNSDLKNLGDKIQNNSDKKSGAFGIVSFVCSIVGLLIAGVIFGPLAIVFGIIGMINRKLKGLAIAGLVIGVIDLIVGILLVAAVL